MPEGSLPLTAWTVYKATNSVNGKLYIGITRRSLDARVTDHLNASRNGSKQAFHKAIRKHGAGSFSFEAICFAGSIPEVNELEKLWIDRCQSRSPLGYNMDAGGGAVGVSSKKRVVSVPSSRIIDLTGRTFGRLTVISLAEKRSKCLFWECKCVCGGTKAINGASLKRGLSRSCGCLGDENREVRVALNTTHGQSAQRRASSTFHSWCQCRGRCFNSRNPAFKDYGGRGITVCDRWKDSFDNFLADMGECPPGKSLDRWPNNDGSYEPTNCRWATKREQANNRRLRVDAHLIAFQGLTKHLSAWAVDFNISKITLLTRLRHGWPVDRALTERPGKYVAGITFNGVTKPLTMWAKDFGIPRGVLSGRINESGWTIEKALTVPYKPRQCRTLSRSIL